MNTITTLCLSFLSKDYFYLIFCVNSYTKKCFYGIGVDEDGGTTVAEIILACNCSLVK